MRATEMHRNLREGSPRIAVGAALGLRSGSLASNGGDTDVHCGHWVRGGSILPRICYPCVAAGLSNKSDPKRHAPFNFDLLCRHQRADSQALHRSPSNSNAGLCIEYRARAVYK